MSLYLAAPAYSLLSERGMKPIRIPSPGDIDGRVIPEIQAARWAMGLIALCLMGYLIFRLLPQPTATPIYAKLAPAELQSQQIFTVHPVSNGKSNGNNGNGNSNGNSNGNGNSKPNSVPNKHGKPTK
jgi:hypothetical protein